MHDSAVFGPVQYRFRVNTARILLIASLCAFAAWLGSSCQIVRAQDQKITWTQEEKPITQQIGGLRQLPDDVRARTTKRLAIQIRGLPASANKVRLASGLANLSTEGDFGHDTLQEVAATLADALRERPVRTNQSKPAGPYIELAQLARYERVEVKLDDAQFSAAMSMLEADDLRREQIDFSLADISGKEWHLRELRGKVVLVNFWATWCPPCRKEMPDLETLYKRFEDQGLVILSISDEDGAKVRPFVKEMKVTYPVLLDPGRKVTDMFQIYGIPKSFVYDRSGKLVAQSIDMRTQKQFLEMLSEAGLQ